MCLLIFICWGCGGGDTDKEIAELKRRAQTLAALTELWAQVSSVSVETGEPPPALAKPLVIWLRDHGADLRDPVRVQDGLLLDGWGNPMHLVVEDGRLLTLGSSGANGRWEEGRGDDILGRSLRHYGPESGG